MWTYYIYLTSTNMAMTTTASADSDSGKASKSVADVGANPSSVFSEYSKTIVVTLYSAYFSYVLMGFSTFFGKKESLLPKFVFLGVAVLMLLFSVIYGLVMTHNFRKYLAHMSAEGRLDESGVSGDVVSGWRTHVVFHVVLSAILLATLFVYVLSLYTTFVAPPRK